MPIDWKRQDKESITDDIGYTNRLEMDSAIRNICIHLSQSSSDFSNAEVLETIVRYVRNHERLMYSGISNYIFAQNDIITDDMVSNADSLLDYAYSNRFYSEILQQFNLNEDEIDRCRRIILKINDHIHLVIQQLHYLKIGDSEYAERFEKQMQPVTNKLVQDMNAQLVTLVGMFTALAFIIFGGISEFNNIFSDISSISIFKLLMLGSVWGICLINLIYIFLFCIGKMTGLNFATARKSPNASIFQKYPIVWWSNFIVIMILLVNMWLYFVVYRMQAVDVFITFNFSGGIRVAIMFIGFAVLLLFAIFVISFLIKKCNPSGADGSKRRNS